MFKKIGPATYEIPKEGGMRVPGLIIAHDLEDLEKPLEQVRNVAHLPGIVGYSIAMPDIHWGYGLPIGGVAAMDINEGVISPGGVGYDINCGVRLAVIPIPYKSLNAQTRHLILSEIFKLVPSGVGRGQKKGRGLSERDYKEIAQKGAKWSVEQGYGYASDLKHMESHGFIEGADADVVSDYAKKRGEHQLGSIGSGNHFVEIGEVQKLFTNDAFDLEEGQTYLLIHSGSRGFGHQICQDTLNEFVKKGFAEGLPDRQLVAAPIQSEEGQRYFAAMATAANYAFNNRQQILHEVREALRVILQISPEEVRLVYDVAHNIAKFEEHNGRKLCIHRKGATRAFKGQPVLVPGDMGTASYVLRGEGNPLTWCSSCHGAGRARSRVKSKKAWQGRDPIAYMTKQEVEVMATSMRTVVEEMPDAYKDVDNVVQAVEDAHLATRVARLRPHLVVKG